MTRGKYIKNGFECSKNCGKLICYEDGMCLSCSHKGHIHTNEQKLKIGIASKNIERTKEWYQKVSNALKGKPLSIETRKKMSKVKIGIKPHKENCQCIYCKGMRGELKGKDNQNWLDGRTSLVMLIRHCKKYIEWKIAVFLRDNRTCQKCGYTGQDIEAHHIKPFSVILKEFLQLYHMFSPIEDKEVLIRLAEFYESFWIVDNGQTLCEKCHDKYKKETIKILMEVK